VWYGCARFGSSDTTEARTETASPTWADPGCADAADVDERDPTLPCDDGADNDGDGGIDWDGGAAAGAPDPHCAGKPWRNKATPATGPCGSGAERALLLPIGITRARRRRARRTS
jgi:hypothetical protein